MIKRNVLVGLCVFFLGVGAVTYAQETTVELNPGSAFTVKDSNLNTILSVSENGVISGFAVVPIGSIIAWHKNLPGVPVLSDDWVECNGQVLSDSGSPLHGQTIPNLNGTGRFLRGSATSGTLQTDEFKAHYHLQGYDDTALSGKFGKENGGGHAGRYEHSDSGSAPGNTSARTSTKGGSETRPKNMSVVWIMRVK